MSSLLDRQAPCPSCGATITFKFAGARAQVCEYCNFVIARTDRGLQATGRMGELLEIPTPLTLGAQGQWHNEPFIVEGRIQMDRAGAPGAPWQEILVAFPLNDRHTWVAYAQGKWYATNEVPAPETGLPPFESLGPGSQVNLGSAGQWVVAEVGQRRVVSGEGAMTAVPAPGVITRYVDMSAPGGQFGTIDYGDGSAAPVLFIGRQFDPRELALESGMPLEAPQASVKSCECPNCGGDLPLVSQQSERMVCQYCGTASDISQGHLSALGPAPPPPIQPYVPLGAQGHIRGNDYTVCGFMIRSCYVDGIQYSWREYLLFGGESTGYRWLMEEDGAWYFVEPVEAGEILDSGNSAMLGGASYHFKQQVDANVDYVVGEFYWKIEIGEKVEATEFTGPGGKLSRERSPTEVNYTFVSPLAPEELATFGVAPPAGPNMFGSGYDDDSHGEDSGSAVMTIIIVLIILGVLCAVLGGGCSSSGGSYGGGWSK